MGAEGLVDHCYGFACGWLVGGLLVYCAWGGVEMGGGKCTFFLHFDGAELMSLALHRRNVSIVQCLGYL